jgi:hypothetical protein
MLSKRVVLLAVALACAFVLLPGVMYAQTASSGVVTGTVTDAQHAVVPGASVTLTQKGTGSSQTATTDASGIYIFPVVAPGDYSIRFTSKGFRTSVVDVHVDVLKSFSVNITLELGATSETVEVVAAAETQLQTTDSSIGVVLGGEGLERLPAYTRSASSLMFLQPAVSPGAVGADTTGGAMAGARSEQVTFNLDGGDVTSDLEGTNNYISPPNEPQPAPIVPIPQESTEEFRVSTSNPNATFNRSSGAQVAMVTKHGTNAYHGSAYEYHFDSGLAANVWQNGFLGIHRPHQVDNRFGDTFGGPIWKDKLFFFTNYEGRRFYDSSSISRVVPTATLRQGILQFKDCALGYDTTKTPPVCKGGNTIQYNFNPANGPLSTLCNNTGGSVNGTPYAAGACDPRNIGISAATIAQMNLLPAGNDTTLGDGLNYTGFTANYATPFTEDIAVTRVDYKINSNWSAYGTWRWARADLTSTSQIEITGTARSVSTNPFEPGFYSFQVTGQLTPTLTAVTHGSFTRNWWGWNRLPPAPFVSGSDAAMELDGEGTGANTTSSTGKLITDPYNINTQQARARAWDGRDWFIGEDMIATHGRNTFQFGATGSIWHDYHLRTDDVLGGLTSGATYFIQSAVQSQGSYFSPTAAFTPPRCSATANITTDCLTSTTNSRWWDGLYAVLTGAVDHSAQIETRDGNFNPNTLGTPLFDNVSIPAFNTYFQNVWQARAGLTITYGVDWGVQLTPAEQNGKEAVWTYANSGAVVDYNQYLQNRAAALENGNLFNPAWSLTPVNSLATPFHGQMRHTDWGDIGPRLAVAWQPQFNNKVFGNKATVIRGGYAIVYDRTSAVGEALNPLLTGGLADSDQCGGPTFVVGGGVTCTGAATNPTNVFRIGPDGKGVGIPAPTSLPIPYTPNPNAIWPQHLTSSLDPYVTPGYSHSVDFSIQRALPGRMYLEIGYIGRFSRNLPQAYQLNAPDYKMKAGGQTLIQAMDALMLEENGGKPITTQPFFESLYGSANCLSAGFSSCTAMAVNNDNNSACASAISTGDVGCFGAYTLNPLAKQLTGNFIDNMQVYEVSATTDKGFSNYNAGFLSLNKTFSSGLQFQFNWTYSHAIGTQGIGQQYLYSADSPYNLSLNYASEPFDRKHNINFWWYYTLPFGSGARYKSGNGVLDRVIGGWYTSGIYTYYTGLPMWIGGFGDAGAWLLGNGSVAVSSIKNLNSLVGQYAQAPKSQAGNSINTHGVPDIFANPNTVFGSLSEPLLSQTGEWPYDQLRMLPSWNVDLSVGKNIVATERYKVLFTADMFNALNHVLFNEPALDIGGGTFGMLQSQGNTPRRILLGLRFEF